jgi:hypothetical protein
MFVAYGLVQILCSMGNENMLLIPINVCPRVNFWNLVVGTISFNLWVFVPDLIFWLLHIWFLVNRHILPGSQLWWVHEFFLRFEITILIVISTLLSFVCSPKYTLFPTDSLHVCGIHGNPSTLYLALSMMYLLYLCVMLERLIVPVISSMVVRWEDLISLIQLNPELETVG